MQPVTEIDVIQGRRCNNGPSATISLSYRSCWPYVRLYVAATDSVPYV